MKRMRGRHPEGPDGFDELDGFYTFLMGTDRELALVRDAFACKPAVVAETEDYVAIASEFRSLAHLPGVRHANVFEPLPEEHELLYSLVGHDEKFAAHNAAMWTNGLLVRVPAVTPPQDGEQVETAQVRFRTVGDMTCTCPVESDAASPADIVTTKPMVLSALGEIPLRTNGRSRNARSPCHSAPAPAAWRIAPELDRSSACTADGGSRIRARQ